ACTDGRDSNTRPPDVILPGNVAERTVCGPGGRGVRRRFRGAAGPLVSLAPPPAPPAGVGFDRCRAGPDRRTHLGTPTRPRPVDTSGGAAMHGRRRRNEPAQA